ncbi:MAG: M20 family peptidase [Porticoccaceae bacterium]
MKFFKWVLAILLIIIAIIIVRTFMHNPQTSAAIDVVTIDIDEDRASQHLSQAIQFATISPQDPAQRDHAVFEQFIEWAADTYPDVHREMSLQRLDDTLLFKWQGTDATLKPILVTGHYDVVPVIPGTEADWLYPPFSGVIADGVIWGRGALDDKSGVVAMLEASTHLIRDGFKPARSVYLSFGSDEEVGGENGARLVTEYLAAQGVQLAWSLDEGSFVLDDIFPGVDKLLAIVNVAEKGTLNLEIVGKSAGGHSSMPPAKTAVGILAEAIVALQNSPLPGGMEGLSLEMLDTVSRHMPFVPKMMFANQWLFSGVLNHSLSQMPVTNAMLRTTIAPTMLSGSVKSNVLPIEAVAVVNFRVHPRDSLDDIVNHVSAAVASETVEVRVPDASGKLASEVSDWHSDGFATVSTAVQQVYGDLVVAPGLMVAASDSRHYSKVADNAFRFNPFIVNADTMTGFHGTNEKIKVADFAQGIRSYIQIIKNGAQP